MVPKQDSGHPGFWGWFNYERRNWIAMVLLAAGVGTGFGQDRANEAWVKKETAKQVAPVVAKEKVEHKTLAVVQAQLGCQKTRADVATMAAVGAGVPPEAIPSCPATPYTPPLKGALKQ